MMLVHDYAADTAQIVSHAALIIGSYDCTLAKDSAFAIVRFLEVVPDLRSREDVSDNLAE